MIKYKLKMKDGKEVTVTEWRAEKPKALLQISHGMAEHAGRYNEFAEYMAKNRDKVKVGVNFVPQEIDRNVAMRRLAAWGISIDSLSPEQERYINSWNV